MAMRSSALLLPVARANGATPVVSVTLYGPSTRILVKPETPKLRLAAEAGEAIAASIAARKREVRMRPPPMIVVNRSLRAADVTRSGLVDLALGATADVDVA